MTEVADEFDPAEVLGSALRFDGLRWDIRTEELRLADGQVVTRDYVVHPGAVGVIALDAQDRVLLLRQYRHPVGHYLWEPPAGLLDENGEPPLVTAQRELYEESGLEALQWSVLADWFNSPGGSSEGFRCYLARGVREHPHGRPRRDGEETDMPIRWVPLDMAVDLVLAGRLGNPTAVAGVLAAAAARSAGWRGLRPADAPWPQRADLESAGRVWVQ